MEISVRTKLPTLNQQTCVVVAINEGGQLTNSAIPLDKDSNGALSKAYKEGDITGKVGETLLLRNIPGIKAGRLLLVGAGATDNLSDSDYRKLNTAAATTVHTTGSATVISTLTELTVGERDTLWKSRQSMLETLHSAYTFVQHKSQPAKVRKNLKKWILHVPDAAQAKLAKLGAQQGAAINAGADLARDLGNLAPNVCTPEYLAKEARALAKRSTKLKTTVLDETQMKKLGMGSLLSVGQGSRQPSKLICMEYSGASKATKPVVLVGKGITFDTGGISLKGGAAMDEMKYDMCGAGSVFGAMLACVELELACNLVCIVPAAENMPDGQASRPGDIVTTMSGQTVEILNTDAEGRLVLCDALTWAEKFKPAAVIDVATLTGAAVVALGNHASAVMSNEQSLANTLLEAGENSGDRTWQLPLWEEYQQQLDSNFADIANIGGRAAGSITAGCFLARFTSAYSWAHLDIAGVAWLSGKQKGATGRPVRLLIQYLLDNH